MVREMVVDRRLGSSSDGSEGSDSDDGVLRRSYRQWQMWR